jgi:hypothetical protein
MNIDHGKNILSKHACENVKHGFNCMCSWERKHPGKKEFVCEFCGIYRASVPRCNKCEESKLSLR